MDYLSHVVIVIGIYVILAVSLNLIAGYTGLLSISHAAFFGIGAYVAAILAIKLHSPFFLNLACAVMASALMGTLVAAPSLRIRNDYFVIATFAFQVIMFGVFNNWINLTSGPMGLPGIPQPTLLGWRISSHTAFLLLVGSCCAAAFWICWRIVHSPIGRVLKAIREDEALAQAAGKNTVAYKVLVFVIGAAMAAVAGVLYAHYISFIDPTSFTMMESVFIISIVIIGGAGSPWGPVVGAVVLVTLPEVLRIVGLPSAVAANVRQILYGTALVASMMWRPQGLLGEYTFQEGDSQQ